MRRDTGAESQRRGRSEQSDLRGGGVWGTAGAKTGRREPPWPKVLLPGREGAGGELLSGEGGQRGATPPPSNTETQGRFVERSSVKGCILEKSLWMPGAKGQEGGLPTPGEGCWGRGSVLGTFGKCDMKESQE